MLNDEDLLIQLHEADGFSPSLNATVRTGVATAAGKRLGYRVAATRADLACAYRLVHQQYCRRSYIEAQPSRMWLSLHNAIPETTTFLVCEQDGAGASSVVGTVTLVPDSPLGLPMDAIYRAELDRLRAAGRRLGEVTMLAFTGDEPRLADAAQLVRRYRMLFMLFKLVWNEARTRLGLDDLCIAVHPSHSMIYELIGFQDFAPIVQYERVNGNPAIGKRVDLRTVQARLAAAPRSAVYRFFFQQEPAHALSRPAFLMSPEDLAYFFVERTDVLANAPQSAMRYLLNRYRLYHVLQRQ